MSISMTDAVLQVDVPSQGHKICRVCRRYQYPQVCIFKSHTSSIRRKPKPVNNILHISTYTNYPSFSSSNIKFQNYHEKCHLKLKIKTSSIQKYDINVYFEIFEIPSVQRIF